MYVKIKSLDDSAVSFARAREVSCDPSPHPPPRLSLMLITIFYFLSAHHVLSLSIFFSCLACEYRYDFAEAMRSEKYRAAATEIDTNKSEQGSSVSEAMSMSPVQSDDDESQYAYESDGSAEGGGEGLVSVV